MTYLDCSFTYGRTMAPGSPTPGGGRKKSASTMPNTVVVAPMPNARQSTAAAVNPGVRRRERRAYVKSDTGILGKRRLAPPWGSGSLGDNGGLTAAVGNRAGLGPPARVPGAA